MLLTRADTDLLVAALGDPEAAAHAWERWRRRHTIDAAPWPQSRLFTLVGHRLRSAGAADPDLDRLQGTQRHAWAKGVAIAREAAAASEALAAQQVPSLVLKGIGLQFAYPGAGLRAMGDADLLVPETQAATALMVLRAAGWDTGRLGGAEWNHLLLAGKGTVAVRNGWELDLHWRPIHQLAAGLDTPMWEHTVQRTVYGSALQLPDISHQLVVVLAHGLRDGSGSVLQGLCDAMMLVRTGECDAVRAAELARHWQRLAAVREGITLLRRHVPADDIEAFAASFRAALRDGGRPALRDRVAHRARSMTPGRVSLALGRWAAGAAPAPSDQGPTAAAEIAHLGPGRTAQLSDPAVAPLLAREGWSGIERWGRWTDDRRARLAFVIESGSTNGTQPVTFCVHCHLGRRGLQRVGVRVNGRRAAVWKWRGAATSRLETLAVPVGVPVDVEFRIRHLAPIGPIDRRLLGLALQWIRVEPERQQPHE